MTYVYSVLHMFGSSPALLLNLVVFYISYDNSNLISSCYYTLEQIGLLTVGTNWAKLVNGGESVSEYELIIKKMKKRGIVPRIHYELQAIRIFSVSLVFLIGCLYIIRKS